MEVNAKSIYIDRRLNEFTGLSHHHCTSIIQDKEGMIWVGTWNGLDRFDGYSFVTFKSHSGDGSTLSIDRIRDIRILEGNIFCNVEEECFIFNIKTGKFKDSHLTWQQTLYKYRWPKTLPKNIIDKQGIKWTVDSIGVRQTFYKPQFSFRIPQKSNSQVRCLFTDKQKHIWITTKEDATIRIYDTKLHLNGYLGKDGKIHKEYTRFGSPIYCIYQDKNKIIWLGSKPHGLFRLSKNSDNSYKIRHIIRDLNGHQMGHEIYDMKEDKWGRLWIATMDSGLTCIPYTRPNKIQFLNIYHGMKNYPSGFWSIRNLFINHDGIMFLPTTRGLLVTKLEKGDVSKLSFKIHKKEPNRISSLSNTATMFVTEDSNHRVFVCTEGGGINMITSKNFLTDKLNFKHYDDEFMPFDYISSATEYNGSLWFVGTKDLIVLNVDNGTYVNYNNKDWDDQMLFSDAQPISLGNGHWLFGLMNGTADININQLGHDTCVPLIVLTNVLIENKISDYAVSECDTITLNNEQRNIKLSFAALDYKNSENICYRFRLSKDESWNDIGNEHTVTLLNLAPGEYNLYLQSKKANGLWANNIRKITIIVTPTIWQTTIAKTAYIFLTVIFIFFIFHIYFYIRNIRKKQAETLNAYLKLLELQKNNNPIQDNIGKEQSKLSDEEQKMMNEIVNYINEHMSDSDIGVNDLANIIRISRSSLNRKMKNIVGITPKEFIMKAKMNRACTLLKTTNMPVKEIAFECGFSDQNYFGKCFKATFNNSPSDYRQQNII